MFFRRSRLVRIALFRLLRRARSSGSSTCRRCVLVLLALLDGERLAVETPNTLKESRPWFPITWRSAVSLLYEDVHPAAVIVSMALTRGHGVADEFCRIRGNGASFSSLQANRPARLPAYTIRPAIRKEFSPYHKKALASD